ncbi:metallophosphoesterase [Hymenobacter sp. GOD-10R]|uniref:metallophosphoesterase n=1 Tax=Hymenobacter sp. GOD-10R TaxID=3093922 RepID=UPI002D764B28|nr:metallophosphoesterase [Hymenobacter sp. GOD-10R]WRQ30689.1 metallophosphoesterase [Hymenobacter sp. GOD-10R]
METYVIGDLHGAARALEQVLARSPFRPGIDRLIQLGDVADGWPETPACVERLLSLSNSIWLQGNHDWWAAEWLSTQVPPPQVNQQWYTQGGQATYEAYEQLPPAERTRHFRQFFGEQLPYFEDEAGNLYVHGGYDSRRPIAEQDPYDLIWDRDLWEGNQVAKGYRECFIGHTSTWNYKKVPCATHNVWNVDQGAGYRGCVSMLNVRTKEFVQSDPVPSLYPDVQGR